MQWALKDMQAAMNQASRNMSQAYNLQQRTQDKFPTSSKVWLSTANICMAWPIKKLDDRWFSPFEVQEKVGTSAYHLCLPDSIWVHLVFNEVLLQPYKPNRIPARPMPDHPNPEVINGEPEYEVKEVLNSHRQQGGLQYLV